MDQTILDMARCICSEANLAYNFWVEAVAIATYTINGILYTTIYLKTPEELWSGRKPNIFKLRVFECVAYAHSKQGKLDLRALKCMFLGYPVGSKGYKLWDSKSKMHIVRKDVIFRHEKFFMNQRKETTQIQRDLEEPTSRSKVEFSEKEKDEAREEQLERIIEISPRAATEQKIP
ncbi:Retrovirus-related Pol polyprotein from transposon TNT 1-94 [Cucumis melo var. makuwa]|uniref:Retrovirus-related Pol polyprotein from transposon TNT 1-94 n=1 Tax=Cucumis melo var. makuwa TaxID=1194695 RepID=A0A5A7U7L8_CUCMM|nr:Retrovirus-related Pol polyprotein from transposon TNT 1-94 [Cucumis melo var. makuwa]TYK11546.1 Retrovirus-related Pol polyprotein from transposon TNT 1-94 [Cucumis melo var. makuwa]